MGVIDIRDPACLGPAPYPGGPDNWAAPMYHNEDGAMPWTLDNWGAEVFGLALDDESPPNIYVLPTTVYAFASVVAPQQVWRIDGITGDKTVLATLHTGNDPSHPFANKNLGLGQIAYHRSFKQLYVTSFADGWIYRLGLDGTILSTFDPLLGGIGSLYDPTADTVGGPVSTSDRIWGVQVRYGENRLYYGTWRNDVAPYVNTNSVWSVALNSTGDFVTNSERLEVDMSITDTKNMPISDIAFSALGDMLVAERTQFTPTSRSAHLSKTYRFNRNMITGEWELNPIQYQVGAIANGFNSAGGVDISDCVQPNPCNPFNLTLVTADAVTFRSNPQYFLYGMQILPASGGGTADSWGVDFDNELLSQDKGDNGDVEMVRSCANALDQSWDCTCDEDCGHLNVTGTVLQGYCNWRTKQCYQGGNCFRGSYNWETKQCDCYGASGGDGWCRDTAGRCTVARILDKTVNRYYCPGDPKPSDTPCAKNEQCAFLTTQNQSVLGVCLNGKCIRNVDCRFGSWVEDRCVCRSGYCHGESGTCNNCMRATHYNRTISAWVYDCKPCN